MIRRKFVIAMIVATAIFTVFSISANSAFAEEILMEAVVSDVKTLIDKNGEPYARAIIKLEKELNGVPYSVERPLNAFGDMTNKLAAVSPGEKVRVVAEKLMYNNREYYTLLAFPE